MKKNKPNTKLPDGAELIDPPQRLRFGGWIEQIFDAKVERYGITWYRVKDGMGDSRDREDWVGGIHGHILSVHDYHWNGEKFGPSYGSFDGAIIAETKRCLAGAKEDVAELREKLFKAELGVRELEKSISQMP